MQLTNPNGQRHIKAAEKQTPRLLTIGMAADSRRVTLHAAYSRMTLDIQELRTLIDGLHDRLDEIEATFG